MLYLPTSKRNVLFEGSLMKLRHSARTDVGRTRDHNEDSLGVGEDAEAIERLGQLLIVCDGMGGHAAGEVASQMGVEAILQTYYEDSSDDRPAVLTQAFEQANAAIYEKGRGSMGTTGVAALLHHDALHIANVGDSRAYLIRDGSMRQVSRDHSFVSDQVAAGLITPEQARSSPHRNVITRALGHQPGVTVDMFRLPLQIDDIVVLCSDGLHGLVNDDEIARIVSDEPPEEAVDYLIDLANRRGGHDNITVVLAHVDALDWDAQPIVDDEEPAPHERVTVELPVSADREEVTTATVPTAAVSAAVAPPVAAAAPPAPPARKAPAARPAPLERQMTLIGGVLATLLLAGLIFVILTTWNQPAATDPAATPAPTAHSPVASPAAATTQPTAASSPTRTAAPTAASTSAPAVLPTAASSPTRTVRPTITSSPTQTVRPTVVGSATPSTRTATTALQPIVAGSPRPTPLPVRPTARPTLPPSPTLEPPPSATPEPPPPPTLEPSPPANPDSQPSPEPPPPPNPETLPSPTSEGAPTTP